MRGIRFSYLGIAFFITLLAACHSDKKVDKKKPVFIKGLYTFGPEAALFINCKTGKEYWAADSSAQLELQYSQLNTDKPYASVYIEVEGEIKPSIKNGPASAFDSTLTVRKLIAIKKDIPNGLCK
ncbi:hypothetical protein ACFQZS_19245 [Mucilaginibacter calamicampi]|uniref:NlpE C-terminal OB domain-containing protein n=1 Tax=Mucilaginibacter calamicampi TaxID=1302352 RepID=A0ABW2Z1D0_9SPHI